MKNYLEKRLLKVAFSTIIACDRCWHYFISEIIKLPDVIAHEKQNDTVLTAVQISCICTARIYKSTASTESKKTVTAALLHKKWRCYFEEFAKRLQNGRLVTRREVRCDH